MPAAVIFILLLGVVGALVAAGLLVVLAALIAPEWFSKSCSTTVGMFVGMGTAGMVFLVVLCACLGLGLALVFTAM